MTAPVTVVVPVHNQATYLGAALRSVQAQTVAPAEVIVVDDGSTDHTAAVIERLGASIRSIRQPQTGLAAARNAGILAATQEFVALLDADDEWLPAFVESWSAHAARETGATVWYCAARPITADGVPLPGALGGPPVDPARMRDQLLRANFLIPSTIVMRRAAVIDAGLFDPSFRSAQGCEDWDLWLRLLPAHRFAGSARCDVLYRVHDTSMSARTQQMQHSARRVIEKHFGTDDGRPSEWSAEKRRAYGGLYRYTLLSSVQRDDDWSTAPALLRRALASDSSLASDVDLFYALALGRGPRGGSDRAEGVLERNVVRIRELLASALAHDELEPLRRRAWGTAFHALGLAAYNTHNYRQSRQLLASALRLQPHLWRDRVVSGDLVKSFFRGAL